MVNVNRVGDISSFQQPEEQSEQYLTQPGDTMAGVAEAFGLSRQALVEANRFIANPNGPLPPGVYLKLPKKAERTDLQPPRQEQEQKQRERRRRRDDSEDEPEERLSAA